VTLLEEGHSYTMHFGEKMLILGKLPGRKSWCLYHEGEGGRVIHVIAFIPKDEEAQELLDLYEGRTR
jgi:hypothetical protein